MPTSIDTSPKQDDARQPLQRRTGWFRRLVGDLIFVAKRDKKWLLFVLIAFLLGVAAVLAIASMGGPLAPFIYPLL